MTIGIRNRAEDAKDATGKDVMRLSGFRERPNKKIKGDFEKETGCKRKLPTGGGLKKAIMVPGVPKVKE